MPRRIVKEEVAGKTTMRLLQDKTTYLGVLIRDGRMSVPISSADPEELWSRLRRDVGKTSPEYFGYGGAKSRFLGIMKSGFRTPWYLEKERAYKVETRDYLLTHLPLERARQATADDAVIAARVYSKTNLLSQFEHARVHEILKGSEGAEFVSAAAGLADGEMKHSLFVMNKILASHGQPSWPAATYLPFFWRSESNMFLKPKVTCDFAERVGHPFAREYSPRLEPDVYESLLNLASETSEEITDLLPTDRIDLQSFIWVVGGYTAEDVEVVKAGS
jgi:hypothetical protein